MNMIIATAGEPLIGYWGAALIFVGICVISALLVWSMDKDTKKRLIKGMEGPIKMAKELGLELGEEYMKKNQILAYGKNYAFVMKYLPTSGEYFAYIYDGDEGRYKMTVTSRDWKTVLLSAKELVENLDKLD